jgi:putative glycosyltransferase
MKLSIVSTLYESATYVDEFCQRAGHSARKLVGEDFEIVLVNDGSPDASLSLAIKLAEKDSHIIVIDLSRNFGHHKAMMTGLNYARGDQVFLIDCDLEEDPEWLLDFAMRMEEDRVDLVYGVQIKRKGGVIEKFTGWVFYRIFRLLTGISQPDNIVTARLMTRRYVDALVAHRERELNIGGLWISTGFGQSPFVIQKHASSPTTYTLTHKFNHLINAVTSFSNLPLVFTFYVGSLTLLSAVFFIAYLTLRFFFIAAPPSGYTSLIASIWLFSGLIIFFMGLQGIYLSKVFLEVKQRPYTIVRNIFQFPEGKIND